MSDQNDGDGNNLNRRRVLQMTGAAAVGAATTGFASAHGGRGNGNGNGNGNGRGKGRGNGGGNGNGGSPFLEPTTENVVFCGCSQVCMCIADCTRATVIVNGAPNAVMSVPGCFSVDEGQIVAVLDTDNGQHIYCNPNTACATFDEAFLSGESISRDDCTEVGTAPQFGARCGEAFIRELC